MLVVGAPVPEALLTGGPIEQIGMVTDLPARLPSEVLQQRPDIRAAEHQLRAAFANIGAARAQLFPSIRLTASAGTASSALSALFAAGSGAWSFVPQVTMPIFTAGRNRATVRVAEVDRDLALASYERAIEEAFREVADALADRSTIDERFNAQQALVEATADSHRLSDARFKKRGGQLPRCPRLTALDVCGAAGSDQGSPRAGVEPGDALSHARWRLERGTAALERGPRPRTGGIAPQRRQDFAAQRCGAASQGGPLDPLPTDLEERPAPTFDEDPDAAVVHSAVLSGFTLHGYLLGRCSPEDCGPTFPRFWAFPPAATTSLRARRRATNGRGIGHVGVRAAPLSGVADGLDAESVKPGGCIRASSEDDTASRSREKQLSKMSSTNDSELSASANVFGEARRRCASTRTGHLM